MISTLFLLWFVLFSNVLLKFLSYSCVVPSSSSSSSPLYRKTPFFHVIARFFSDILIVLDWFRQSRLFDVYQPTADFSSGAFSLNRKLARAPAARNGGMALTGTCIHFWAGICHVWTPATLSNIEPAKCGGKERENEKIRLTFYLSLSIEALLLWCWGGAVSGITVENVIVKK